MNVFFSLTHFLFPIKLIFSQTSQNRLDIVKGKDQKPSLTTNCKFS